MTYESRFLLSLWLTLSVEVPTIVLLQKYVFRLKDIPARKIIAAGCVASVLTLPYLWFILPACVNSRYYPYAGESVVIITEGIIFYLLLDIKLWKSLLISAIANICSFGAGLLLKI